MKEEDLAKETMETDISEPIDAILIYTAKRRKDTDENL